MKIKLSFMLFFLLLFNNNLNIKANNTEFNKTDLENIELEKKHIDLKNKVISIGIPFGVPIAIISMSLLYFLCIKTNAKVNNSQMQLNNSQMQLNNSQMQLNDNEGSYKSCITNKIFDEFTTFDSVITIGNTVQIDNKPEISFFVNNRKVSNFINNKFKKEKNNYISPYITFTYKNCRITVASSKLENIDVTVKNINFLSNTKNWGYQNASNPNMDGGGGINGAVHVKFKNLYKLEKKRRDEIIYYNKQNDIKDSCILKPGEASNIILDKKDTFISEIINALAPSNSGEGRSLNFQINNLIYDCYYNTFFTCNAVNLFCCSMGTSIYGCNVEQTSLVAFISLKNFLDNNKEKFKNIVFLIYEDDRPLQNIQDGNNNRPGERTKTYEYPAYCCAAINIFNDCSFSTNVTNFKKINGIDIILEGEQDKYVKI